MHHGRTTRLAVLAAVGLTGLLLAGCGKDGGTKQSEGRTTTTEATTETSEETTTTLGTTESTDTTLDTGTTLASGVTTTTASGGGSRATTTTARSGGSKATTTTVKPKPVTTTTVAGSRNSGTIKLGAIGTSINTTTGAKTTEETRKMAAAWESRINARGGINGYKVDVIYKDNGADSAKTLNAVKELDAAGVDAIVGQTIFSQMPAVMSYLEQKKIPVIGGTPWFPQSQTSPMFFTISGNYDSGVFGIVNSANNAGAKHFRKIYCSEVAACQGSEPPMRDAAQRLGLKFSSQSTSALKTDFTAECLSAKNAGADFLQVDGPPLSPVVRDCARQNYHPLYGNGGGSGQALIDNLQGEQYANAIFELGTFNDFPELDDFKTLTKSTDLTTAQITQTSLQTYEGFRMAEKIIGFMSGSDPSRADFLNATYQIKGENLGGLLAPQGVDFSVQKDPSRHSSYDCWTEFTVNEGKFKPTGKGGTVVRTAAANWQCGSGFYKSDGFPVHPEF